MHSPEHPLLLSHASIYVMQPEAGGKSLLDLPNEVLQHVASFVSTDQDLRNLNLVCREMRDRVLAPESVVWRARFDDEYDLPAGRANAELKVEYQTRALVLPQTIDFRQETSEHQKLWLEVLQQMVLESLTLPLKSDTSKTYERIRETLTDSDLLEHPWRENPTELFCTVQLCLSALALSLDPADESTPAIKNKCTRSEYDIATVYSHGNQPNGPFIDHGKLDLATLLHMRSFWQRHLLNKAEQTYHESFAKLPEQSRPQARKSSTGQEAGLSVSWLGYYSCLHPMPASRNDFEDQETCADLRGDHLSQVEVMTLNITIKPNEPFWPDPCNRIIPLHGDETHRTYFRGTQSTLNGDPAENPVFGFCEAIAHPYGGFPGWTRICFAICEEPESSVDEDEMMDIDDSDGNYHWVHGYEGVILPGGRIMLGRWMDLKNMDASGRGPFIFWDL